MGNQHDEKGFHDQTCNVFKTRPAISARFTMTMTMVVTITNLVGPDICGSLSSDIRNLFEIVGPSPHDVRAQNIPYPHLSEPQKYPIPTFI